METTIDPLKYAGEGWFATDEYFPNDIQDPYTRGDVRRPGYYPKPDIRYGGYGEID